MLWCLFLASMEAVSNVNTVLSSIYDSNESIKTVV